MSADSYLKMKIEPDRLLFNLDDGLDERFGEIPFPTNSTNAEKKQLVNEFLEMEARHGLDLTRVNLAKLHDAIDQRCQ